MQKLIFLISLTILASSCKKEDETFSVNQCGIDFNTSIKYLALGDEFNTGFLLQANEAWPNEVREYLTENGYPETELTIIGEEGLTSSDLKVYFGSNSNTQCKNLTTVMVGVHDLLEGHSVAQFTSDYSELIDDVLAHIGSAQRMTCVCLPDFSQAPGMPSSAGTPEEAKAQIQAYNTAISEICTEKGVGFADIFPISQAAYSMTLAEDDFHANAAQHLLWANVISGIVEEGLE
jgi:lysophospholipase L1-like esterase